MNAGQDSKANQLCSRTQPLIERWQAETGSSLLVYFTGDRQPFGSRVAEDAVRPMYDHLLALSDQHEIGRMDLFLYSRGGDVSVPWRIVSMIRQFCSEFNIIVPYRAQSAATLISLGADHIMMGRKAELGPIDPTLVRANVSDTAVPPQEIAVEDVNSYVAFLKDRVPIKDQRSLTQLVARLVDKIGPLTVGSVNRQHYHIRLIAEKLIRSRARVDSSNRQVKKIIEILTQRMYSHGHAIGRDEARNIGLPVVFPERKVEDLMWELYLAYEEFLELRNPIDFDTLLGADDKHTVSDMPLAVIESLKMQHQFRMNADIVRKRNVPPNPQININLNLQLPPGLQPSQVPQQQQTLINQLLQQLSQLLPGLVHQEIMRQSPTVGFEARGYAGNWLRMC